MLPWEIMPQMQTAATAWNLANHFIMSEDMAADFKAALEDGDPRLVAAARGDIARTKGMTQIAWEAGLGRERLYKALSSSGNPERGTVLKVISAFGLQLHASPAVEAETGVQQCHSPGPPPHDSLPTPEITAAR